MADVRKGCGGAEEWVRQHAFPTSFPGKTFAKKRVPLKDGGSFEFDAVAHDGTVLGLISTSARKTVTGNANTGAIRKINSDLFRFSQVLAPNATLVLAFTEESMAAGFERAQRNGKVPASIRILHVRLPDEIQSLVEADRGASRGEQGAAERPYIDVNALPEHLRKYVK